MKGLEFHKQVPKNLLLNILSFISTIVIGIWLTPYLLKHLGIIAYGFIPLAMFFSQYISVIINSINTSINRFLVLSLQKEDYLEANKIFTTSFIILCFFIFLQVIFMIIVLFDINLFFKIPKYLLDDVVWLFGLTFVGFSISLLRGIFGTSLFAYNRLDILRVIDIIQNITRILIIVILFFFETPSLKYIGIANLLASLIAIIPTLYYFRKYTPQIEIKLFYFEKSKVKELFEMSQWVLINQVGVLLIGNIDLYMVNFLLGTKEMGEYAIILQVIILFKTLSTLLLGVISPIVIYYYANKSYEKLKTIILLSSKLITIVMMTLVLFVIFFSQILLKFWLGDMFVYLYPLLSFSLLFLIFSIPAISLFQINVVYNRVKLPAILTLILGILNIIGVYILLSYTQMGLWGVVIAKLVYEFIFNVIFMPLYGASILKISKWYFFDIFIFLILSLAFLSLSLFLGDMIYSPQSFWQLFIFGIVYFIFSIVFQLFIFLSKIERDFLFEKYIIKIDKLLKRDNHE